MGRGEKSSRLSAGQVGDWWGLEAGKDTEWAHMDDVGYRERAYDFGDDGDTGGDWGNERWCEGLGHGNGLGRVCVLNLRYGQFLIPIFRHAHFKEVSHTPICFAATQSGRLK
uniref:Uncharacterized protein n=1 Tax=Cryptomonas curvata TaxID=233186 RepID=A0A7S0MGS6_9CRYP